jgi:hypothetical protein
MVTGPVSTTSRTRVHRWCHFPVSWNERVSRPCSTEVGYPLQDPRQSCTTHVGTVITDSDSIVGTLTQTSADKVNNTKFEVFKDMAQWLSAGPRATPTAEKERLNHPNLDIDFSADLTVKRDSASTDISMVEAVKEGIKFIEDGFQLSEIGIQHASSQCHKPRFGPVGNGNFAKPPGPGHMQDCRPFGMALNG